MREGAQQVERRSRLAVRHDLAFRIRNAGLFGELDAVDDVAAIARQFDAVLRFDVGRTRLGELAGDAADLDDRLLGAEGQHDGHLQERRGRSRGCCRRRVRRSSRRNRRPAAGSPSPSATHWQAGFFRRACLACKDQRRIGRKLRFGCAQALPSPENPAPAGWASAASCSVSNSVPCQSPVLLHEVRRVPVRPGQRWFETGSESCFQRPNS